MDPNLTNTLLDANALYKAKSFEEALALLDTMSAKFADMANYHNLKGLCLAELNEHNQAVPCFVEAIKLNPLDPLPYVNIGNSLAKNLQFDEAEKYYHLALTLDENYPEAIVGLGVIAFQRLDYESCEKYFKQALKINPSNLTVLTNLGNCYSVQGKYDEALTTLNKAIARDKENGLARTNRALIKLGRGNFETAWEDYEYRWDSGNFMADRFKQIPRWRGPGQSQKNVLIWTEQGIGDEIMFSSIFHDLTGLSEKFFIECDVRLFDIFRATFPKLEFIPKGMIKNISPIQEQIPIGSLGGIFRKARKSFPLYSSGYLQLSEEHKLPEETIRFLISLPKPWIGVSWESYALTKNFRGRKSISAKDFSVLTSRPEYSFINLQFPNPHKHEKKQIQELPSRVITLPGIDLKDDIAYLGLLLKRLDGVVTIGNSVAHLCGSLGIDTTLLLPKVPDWRWGHDQYLHWYSTLKPIRNTSDSGWDNLLSSLTL